MSALAALFLITLSGPTSRPDLCALVADLNLLIAQATDYTPPPCPVIGFSLLPQAGALRSQAGAFLPASGAIELAPDLDLTSAFGQSYLLHELVHAAQYAAQPITRDACTAALEAEAYAVQSDFLRDAGLTREAVMLRLLADQLGRCAD